MRFRSWTLTSFVQKQASQWWRGQTTNRSIIKSVYGRRSYNTIGEITQPAKIRVTVMNGRHKMIISRTVFVAHDCSIVLARLHFGTSYALARHFNGVRLMLKNATLYYIATKSKTILEISNRIWKLHISSKTFLYEKQTEA